MSPTNSTLQVRYPLHHWDTTRVAYASKSPQMIFPKNSKTSLSIALNGSPSHVWSSTLRPLPLQLFLYALCGCIYLIAGMSMADQQGAPGIAMEHLTPAATLDSLLHPAPTTEEDSAPSPASKTKTEVDSASGPASNTVVNSEPPPPFNQEYIQQNQPIWGMWGQEP